MLCVISGQDKSDSLELRMKVRPDHLVYIEASGVTWTFAGPVLTDDGQTPKGSLFIGEFESLEAAKAFAKNDPYNQAGLFEKSTVQPVRKTYPK